MLSELYYNKAVKTKWMANKHVKRCLISIVTKEMQIKTTVRYHYTPKKI